MNRAETYQIFGKAVRVQFEDSTAGEKLHDELSLYPSADTEPEFTFRHRPVNHVGFDLANPSIHKDSRRGFSARYTLADVNFVFDGDRLQGAEFYPRSGGNELLRLARRWMDIQFASRRERIGMIFHELVLIPAVTMMDNLVPIHASAFADIDGGTTLIAGTGGVGKTSLELEMCLRRGKAFVADDFVVVDRQGFVWPNLAYPKIYGYNMVDDDHLYHIALRNGSVGDRLHWHLHKMRGPDRVRRRVSPAVLYPSYRDTSGSVKRLVIIARAATDQIVHRSITQEEATELCLSVSQPELAGFIAHLHWHDYNRRAARHLTGYGLSDEPPLRHRLPTILTRWRETLSEALAPVPCEIIFVPVETEHRTFIQQVAERLM